MAEEVEITNVGGKDGVASEATLNMLLESFDKLAKGQGTEARKAKEAAKKYHEEMTKNGIEIKNEKEAREENTEATKSATARLNAFAKSSIGLLVTGFSAVAGNLYNFGEELVVGGNRLSDFAQHVPLVGGYLSILTGIVDESIDTFRELSQVGATFSGGLTEFRRLAGEAAMPLDEFNRLVSENSEVLRVFGSDTAVATKNFVDMANNFRKGPGRELMNIGFTVQELNEVLLDYADIQAVLFGRDRAQSKITSQNAAEFAMTLQQLSALTGKRRDQLKEEMQQTASDARTRMAISSMLEEEQERFQQNLALAPESLKNVFIDMADNVPNEELTQKLLILSDTFAAQAGDIENMDMMEMQNMMFRVSQEVEAKGADMGEAFQGIIASVPGFSEAFSALDVIRKRGPLTAKEFEKMQERIEAATQREDSILQFAETLNTIRGNLQVAFVESGLLQVVEDLATKFTDFLSNPKTIDGLESALESVSAFLNKFITDIDEVGFKQALLNILYDISDAFLDFFLGPNTKMTGHPGIDQKEIDIEREGGFWQEMLKPLMSQAVDTIVEGVSAWWSETSPFTKAMIAGAGALFVAGGPIASAFVSGIAALFASRAVKNAAGGAAASLFSMKKLGKLLKFGTSLPFLAATLAVTPSELGDGTVTGNIDQQMADEGLTPETMGNEAWHKERERRIDESMEDMYSSVDENSQHLDSLSEKLAAEQDKLLAGENVYTGFDSRGRKTTEPITKLVEQTEKYLSQLDKTASKQEDTESIMSDLSDTLKNTTANQGNSEAMQELNTTMMQILAVLRQAKTIEERIEKNTSSIGGNIANGRVSNIR